MGKSILESFAAGRAVVASDLGSRRELVKDGNTGLLYAAGDVPQLAEAIRKLYQDDQAAIGMGDQAREYIQRNHSPEAHCAKLTKIYENLCQSGKGAVKPSLRIAFIGGRGVISKYSGIETYYEEAGKQLVRQGHRVTIYCRSYFSPPTPVHNGMKLIRLPTIRTKHLETLVHTFLSTVHVIFSDCQIVHYQALGPALFSFLPRIFGKKTVVTIQGLDWQRKKWNWMARAVLRIGDFAAIHFPDATIAVSKTLRQQYTAGHNRQIWYVPNGTTLRFQGATPELKQWSLQPGKYILFLGRFSPEKNCNLLIEAYESLKPSSFKLVLAGGSSYSDAYSSQLRKHESDQIRILDWVHGENLDDLLCNAGIFVLPSDLEGMSLALLDAMGAGICVLSSDVPENREVVDGIGYTFRAGAAADLERTLKLLIASSECREIAGRSGRKRVQTSYLWPEITRQIEEVYFSIFRESRKVEARRRPKVLPTDAKAQVHAA